MLTATKDRILPTTVTGSWPRPAWYTQNLARRPFSDAMTDIAFREQLTDAIEVVLGDQDRAGLDILTNGDYHLDADHAGRSWFIYPTERLTGMSEYSLEPTNPMWSYPVGTWLNEIVGGWKFPLVVGKVEPRIPFEFAKIWRVAQSRTDKPVKFGTISADLASAVLNVGTDVYDDDKRELMWDIAVIINAELRQLAAAGCKVIQIEEPAIHSTAAYTQDEDTLNFFVDLFNRQVEGLDGVEIWIHTCWGNPGAQHCFDPEISYENSIDLYLNKLAGDVWTIESKDSDHRPLALFEAYKGNLPKKVAVGFISHRTLQVETPESIAADVRRALEVIDPEHLVLSSDCGFGRQGVPRPIAFHKAAALAQAANIVRHELGAPETETRAADPMLQIDVPEQEATLVS
ncbi:MAG TPA: cobalamin-independent methionine synthase II family protein [Gaiellaceae bacterium]|jgi:5-methyltetrahydropteroyltriglutamate--homocysteine methyltransferase|nr:cobalamin-independent methionine synthase II family protein [Gaiellaceae bacterium]